MLCIEIDFRNNLQESDFGDICNMSCPLVFLRNANHADNRNIEIVLHFLELIDEECKSQ
jgi:hypothetical protein